MRQARWPAAALGAAALLAWFGHNLMNGMAQRGLSFSYGFMAEPFGIDFSFHLLPWQAGSTRAYALVVALANTVFASALSIALASLIGLVLGLLRLSGNLLASGTAYAVIEAVRNVPLLTQIIFLYVGVQQYLPPPRGSLLLLPHVYLNVRGLFLPVPQPEIWEAAALVLELMVCVAVLLSRWPRRRLAAVSVAIVGILGLGLSTSWSRPVLKEFGFSGGWLLTPELLAVWLGVSLYVSAFIAEIVRSAVDSVALGQREAARSLGLHWVQETWLVVLPQALRAMIPPLTNQYLNVVKATTLGAAIAFPEVVQVFARSIMNQTGRSVEIMLLVLAVYVGLNLCLSGAMNAWSRSLAVPGR